MANYNEQKELVVFDEAFVRSLDEERWYTYNLGGSPPEEATHVITGCELSLGMKATCGFKEVDTSTGRRTAKEFDYPKELLPEHVTDFMYYVRSEQPFPKVFHPGLKRVYINTRHLPALTAGLFPEGVLSIEIVSNSVCPNIEPGVFPSTLKELTLSFKYSSPIEDGVLPEGLEKLVLYNGYFPKFLEVVRNPKEVRGVLPSTLKVYENTCLDIFNPDMLLIYPEHFPSTIEVVKVRGREAVMFLLCNSEYPNLISLEINSLLTAHGYLHGVSDRLWAFYPSLETSPADDHLNEVKYSLFGDKLTHLIFDMSFSSILTGTPPESLTSLELHNTKMIPQLPKYLERLTCDFNSSLDMDILPFSLKYLDVMDTFSLAGEGYPPILEELIVSYETNLESVFARPFPETLKRFTNDGLIFKNFLKPGIFPKNMEQITTGRCSCEWNPRWDYTRSDGVDSEGEEEDMKKQEEEHYAECDQSRECDPYEVTIDLTVDEPRFWRTSLKKEHFEKWC